MLLKRMTLNPTARPNSHPNKFLQIDEEGYFLSQGLRLSDEKTGLELLQNLTCDDRGRVFSQLGGEPIGIEAFDAPLVLRHSHLIAKGRAHGVFAYGFESDFLVNDLSCDEWDRFHGITLQGIPFVFSRSAQFSFFDQVDSFDDTSLTLGGVHYLVKDWLIDLPEIDNENFWSNIYRNETPGWELERETPILPNLLAQIKIPKSRIICLGSGSGNDAAFFANQGHIVTAVDISEEALKRARDKYAQVKNLNFVRANVFDLPKDFFGSFDLVFEHTCYCAIRPPRRDELVKVWHRLLCDGGHLLGIFFAVERRKGPPYGGSEYEIKRRLNPLFQFNYWTRWKHSLERRHGMELVVYAQKKS